MRIAIVSDAVFPYNKGGKETRIHELSTRLAAAGHQVTIYTMKWWDGPERMRVENGVTLKAISPKLALYHGERRSVWQGVVFGVACLGLITEKFDVVDVDHMPYFPLFFTKIACFLKRKPMTATWHEVWGVRYWQTYLGRAGLLAGLLEKLTVLMPSRIIAASELTAQRLKHDMKFQRALAVIPNGIDAAAIAAVLPAEHRSDVLYAGRLLEHKHVDLLLQAVALLKASHPDISCFVVGDGPERTRLEQLSRELNLEKNVKFWGFLPENSQVYGFMKASRVFVSPSTREGFGLSVLEANGCGLPVVTVNHPDNAAKYLITQTNGRVAELSAGSIAACIEELLNADIDGQKIVELAREYDWNQAAATAGKVYAQ